MLSLLVNRFGQDTIAPLAEHCGVSSQAVHYWLSEKGGFIPRNKEADVWSYFLLKTMEEDLAADSLNSPL